MFSHFLQEPPPALLLLQIRHPRSDCFGAIVRISEYYSLRQQSAHILSCSRTFSLILVKSAHEVGTFSKGTARVVGLISYHCCPGFEGLHSVSNLSLVYHSTQNRPDSRLRSCLLRRRALIYAHRGCRSAVRVPAGPLYGGLL